MEKLRSVILGVVICSLGLANSVYGQADDIGDDRWSGNTFHTPAAGYSQGDALTLTWSIVADGTSIFGYNGEATGNSDLIAMLDSAYSVPMGTPLTSRSWFAHFESSFDRWSSISGLSYEFVADDNAAMTNATLPSGVSGARGDIRIGGHSIDGASGNLAYNFFPNTGDMVIDTDDAGILSNQLSLRNILAHEHGHGLGMEHLESNNSRHLMEPFLDTTFDGPQFHDIAQAQRGYGDVNEKTNGGLGNDVVANATSLGSIADGGTIEFGLDASDVTTVVASNMVDFVSIDDQTDTDFYSILVGETGTLDLTLDPRGPTFNSRQQGFGAQVSVNYKERVNLGLEFLDQDGVSVLGLADNFGFGGSEELLGLNVTAGTYFVRVFGTENPDANLSDIQFYSFGAAFSATAVPEPNSFAVIAAMGLFVLRRRRA